VIDKIPTDDEVQITNDSNPNRPLLFLSLHILWYMSEKTKENFQKSKFFKVR
jgi:hypothetical protein